MINKNNDEVFKFIVGGKTKNIDIFKNELLKAEDLSFFQWSYFSGKINNLEINPKNTDKWYALKHIAVDYDIDLEKTVAIGDGGNDKLLIENCKIGAAMKNANAKIKNVADYVTKNNNKKAGVSEVVNKFF